jgi:gliding motility-associated-like protein
MRGKKWILSVLVSIICCSLYAQEFSNKGKDFWLGYGYHVRMDPAQLPANYNAQNLILYFTSDQNANVLVEIPGVGYSKTYQVIANQVTISEAIPKIGSQDVRLTSPGLSDKGIHITSDRSIVAYVHNFNMNVSGASVLFPTNTLGKEYYAVGYTQNSNEPNSNAFFFIIATEDSTTVEITPSAANLNGLPVGVATRLPYKLIKGQIYHVMGVTNGEIGADLTGSKIRSISTTSTGCKPIAVFSGTGKMNIGIGPPRPGTNQPNRSSDNFIAQAFPSNAWGTKYLTAPTGSQPNNFFRVCVKDPSTIVYLNGVQLPFSLLQNGFFYEFKNGNQIGFNPPTPNSIESDKPILVAQFCTTQNAEGNTGDGDPEMIYLSPVEQTINKITVFSASSFQINQSFINVIIKNEGVNSFTLDGMGGVSFQTHPGDPNYSYAMIPVGSGASHALYSDSGFNAIAYGFGDAESYGYNAGTNIVDLNPPISLKNEFASSGISYSATCTNAPFRVKVTIPYLAIKLKVDFGTNPNLTGTNPFVYTPPSGPDSSYFSNGKTFYVYEIPNTYKFNKTGSFPVKIVATSVVPQSDGCSNNNDQDIEDNVVVNDPPIADFSISTNGCINTSVLFSDSTNGFGRQVYKWFWDFGSGPVVNTKNVARNINAYTSSVKLTSITDFGCVATTTKTVELSNKPIARFNFSTPNCLNTDIVFSNTSTLVAGPNNNTIQSWIWDFDNGQKIDTLSTGVAQTKQYTTEGVKNIGLIVRSNTGCPSDAFKPIFSIKPTPVVIFKTPKVCLDDAFAPFNDESTISDGTGAFLTRKWTFLGGLPATSTSKTPLVRYPAPGPYDATLEVKASSGCIITLTKPFFINGGNPKADFELVGTTPFCQPAPVQIKNKSSVDIGAIARVEIYWDYLNNPTQKDSDDDPLIDKIYAHKYADLQLPNAQTYTIRLVAYTGGGSCVNFIEKTISIFPQPKAKYNQSATQICANQSVNFLDLSNGISSSAQSYFWNFGTGGRSLLKSPRQQFLDSGLVNISMYFNNSDGCRSDTAQSTLTVFPNPKLFLRNRQNLFFGEPIPLIPDSLFGNNLRFLWTPATYLDNPTLANPICSASDDITYTLQITGDGGCTVSKDIFILVLKPPKAPNAFSPNGDGINDTWKIQYLERYPEATVDVFDRYGQLVYQVINYTTPWDGSFKGKPLPIGTYYYIINPKNGKPTISGSVTILK